MTTRWIGRIVRLEHAWKEGGLWKVTALDGDWCLTEPRDEISRGIARISPDGVVWFRKRDLTEDIAPQKERLL